MARVGNIGFAVKNYRKKHSAFQSPCDPFNSLVTACPVSIYGSIKGGCRLGKMCIKHQRKVLHKTLSLSFSQLLFTSSLQHCTAVKFCWCTTWQIQDFCNVAKLKKSMSLSSKNLWRT